MKNEALLEVNRLHVSAGEKEILHGVDLTVGRDETHVLMGPNGTGKSTLGYAVTGNPVYTVTSGSIVFDGEDITALPVNERAKRGIFLSFQNPLEVPGVTLSAFIRSAARQRDGLFCVICTVGYAQRGRSRGDAHKTVFHGWKSPLQQGFQIALMVVDSGGEVKSGFLKRSSAS